MPGLLAVGFCKTVLQGDEGVLNQYPEEMLKQVITLADLFIIFKVQYQDLAGFKSFNGVNTGFA